MAELYFIQADALIPGKRVPYFPERDPDSMGHRETVSDIMSGEVANARKVFCWDTEAQTMRDVSEDIANDICGRVVDGEPMPCGGAVDYLEEHLGCEAVAGLVREFAA